jgi:hypothetical protein
VRGNLIPALKGKKVVRSHSVQIGTYHHLDPPILLSTGYRGLFAQLQRGWVVVTTDVQSVPRITMRCTSIPRYAFTGRTLIYIIIRSNRYIAVHPLLLHAHVIPISYPVQAYAHIRISFQLIFNGCETWSLTLREERRLGVFENRMLRRIFGPKRGEVLREWRKLHNKELNDLYSSPIIMRVIKSRRMRWAGHVPSLEEEKGV